MARECRPPPSATSGHPPPSPGAGPPSDAVRTLSECRTGGALCVTARTYKKRDRNEKTNTRSKKGPKNGHFALKTAKTTENRRLEGNEV